MTTALFGEEGIPYLLVYFFANCVFIWTVGLYAIQTDGVAKTGGARPKLVSMKSVRMLFSPPLLSFIVGIAFVVLSIPIPHFVAATVKSFGSVTSPLALFFIGGFSGAGLPLDLPSYLTPESTTKLVPIVSSSRAAKIICDKWQKNYNYLPDAIVVEGPKAGGHLGFKKEQLQDQHYALETLIPEVVMIASSYKEQKQIPVIVAGGISTGEDIAHFMGLGAAGVQMGSIFVTTQECDASETFKEVYIHSKSEDVLIIESPVGMPGRAIDGEFIHNVNSGLERPKSCSFHCIKTCDYTKSPYCIIKALYNAAKGNMKKGYAFAGSNAFLAEKISSVKEVMSTLEREFFLATHKLA